MFSALGTVRGQLPGDLDQALARYAAAAEFSGALRAA
jgi:hypothetical protein